MTPDLVEAVARDLCDGNRRGWPCPTVCDLCKGDAAKALALIGPAVRAEALQEAASICDALRKKGINNDVEYREACRDAAAAILELIDHPKQQETTMSTPFTEEQLQAVTKKKDAENERLRAALEWYAEQAAGCRKLGSIGDPFRHALDRDGGDRARAALTQEPQR